MDILTVIVTLVLAFVYVPALILLLIYSLNLYFMIIVTVWRQRRVMKVPKLSTFPKVTVQVPLYNERYVSRRVINAVAELDWPTNRLQIQILDDSTDETVDIVAECVAEWKAKGLDIVQVRRPDRVGYKAGALSYAMDMTDGDYVAIFDADFIPPVNFLRETIPLLEKDEKAAFIQTRWDHINLGDSWLTRIQAVAMDSHFMIEQFARFNSGFAFNFNGTAGVWRRSAIEDAGGWQSDTLTEDMDLSYRAWLRGWHGLYKHDLRSPAELPPTITAFRRQQTRWQRGSIECARMLLPTIWQSKYGFLAKLQATIHLLGPMVTPVMAFLMISYPFFILLESRFPGISAAYKLVEYIGPLTIAPTLFFILSQALARRPEWRSFFAVVLCQVMGAGMSMNTLRAVMRGLYGKGGGEFLRTPKYGSTQVASSVYHLKADMGVALDFLWGLFCLLAALIGSANNHNFIVVYGLMSCLGSWWVALWSLLPNLQFTFGARTMTLTTK
jgi:cellulose synthase/poly-beta-1,6-N-acetylglucosamine synthase-like glycosyltransferase